MESEGGGNCVFARVSGNEVGRKERDSGFETDEEQEEEESESVYVDLEVGIVAVR